MNFFDKNSMTPNIMETQIFNFLKYELKGHGSHKSSPFLFLQRFCVLKRYHLKPSDFMTTLTYVLMKISVLGIYIISAMIARLKPFDFFASLIFKSNSCCSFLTKGLSKLFSNHL